MFGGSQTTRLEAQVSRHGGGLIATLSRGRKMALSRRNEAWFLETGGGPLLALDISGGWRHWPWTPTEVALVPWAACELQTLVRLRWAGRLTLMFGWKPCPQVT